MSDRPLDFAMVALVLALVLAVIATPYALLKHRLGMTPLGWLVILLLAWQGVVGSLSRVMEGDATIDYWVRVAIIASRITVIGAITYDLWWLRKRP